MAATRKIAGLVVLASLAGCDAADSVAGPPLEPIAGETVVFRIPAGTGAGPWNTEQTIVDATIGDVLRIYNDDAIDHSLHTPDRPCGHGPVMPPGSSWDCEIERPYDATVEGPLYDHDYGTAAAFWVRAVEN